ncbi:hypothetical protein ACFQZ4_53080 [Catellatospora coxensis]|uniref:Uncharacterized protein n=1 Tax=Catellatospora coxensis TaxID=310354 RepID=A0A8J3PCE1_9ACTN|nr:hypothetical protein [Catellatospora coxensis]GIG11554.1 hypothetical protein Cco03nite_82540 [Catellatospora coxensis]
MNATALADQAEAAARDARRKLASIGGDRPADIASDPWLAEQIGALLLALATDTARLCRHVKPSPMVLHATAWTPGRVVCERCAPQLRPATYQQDTTCDRCGEHTSAIYSGALAFGSILFTFGLCGGCIHSSPVYRPALI